MFVHSITLIQEVNEELGVVGGGVYIILLCFSTGDNWQTLHITYSLPSTNT